MTQCERIVEYINRHGSITPLEAVNDLGCMRLASRITDLRQSGVPIKSEWEEGKNRHGEKTRYKRYFILSSEKEKTS